MCNDLYLMEIISLQESEAQGLGKVDILAAETAVDDEAVDDEAMDEMVTSSRGEFRHSYSFAVPGMIITSIFSTGSAYLQTKWVLV